MKIDNIDKKDLLDIVDLVETKVVFTFVPLKETDLLLVILGNKDFVPTPVAIAELQADLSIAVTKYKLKQAEIEISQGLHFDYDQTMNKILLKTFEYYDVDENKIINFVADYVNKINIFDLEKFLIFIQFGFETEPISQLKIDELLDKIRPKLNPLYENKSRMIITHNCLRIKAYENK